MRYQPLCLKISIGIQIVEVIANRLTTITKQHTTKK